MDDNRRRHWLSSSSFCSPNLTPVQNLGTLHAGYPCCHCEDGKSVSSRRYQPKRRRPDGCSTVKLNRQMGDREQDSKALDERWGFESEEGKRETGNGRGGEILSGYEEMEGR